jgi:hypothetical protein
MVFLSEMIFDAREQALKYAICVSIITLNKSSDLPGVPRRIYPIFLLAFAMRPQ